MARKRRKRRLVERRENCCMRKHKNLFGKHSWSKWEVVERGTITRTRDGSGAGWFLRQERVCEECGFVEQNYERIIV